MTTETHQAIILNVPFTDAVAPPDFREMAPQGIESAEGTPEIEQKIATDGDPRNAVAAWEGVPGSIEVYGAWTESTERWVMFVPRESTDGKKKYNKITFIKDLSHPDEPVQIRRKLALGEDSDSGAPLMRREIYNTEEELPAVITDSGGDPSVDYPVSPHMRRDRVERLVVDRETGHVLSITGDYCYPTEGTGDPLYQCEIEFKGIVGEHEATIEGVMESVDRVSSRFSDFLASQNLTPQPTDLSKSKYIESLARTEGIIS